MHLSYIKRIFHFQRPFTVINRIRSMHIPIDRSEPKNTDDIL